MLVLRRQDGAFVAFFSARGTTKEGIMRDAEEDYRALLREHASLMGQPTEEPQRLAPAGATSQNPTRGEFLRIFRQPKVHGLLRRQGAERYLGAVRAMSGTYRSDPVRILYRKDGSTANSR